MGWNPLSLTSPAAVRTRGYQAAPESPGTGRALRACFGVLILLLVFPSFAAQAADEDRLPRPTTGLEANAVRPADLVLVGRVLHVRDVRSPGGGRGRQLVRVEIKLVLHGPLPAGKEISVMVLGQRPTLNPNQPSVPYFSNGKQDLYVLFLARQSGQYAFRLRTLFEGKGSLGREKIAVTQAITRLAAISGESEKAKRTLAALLAMTKGAGLWTKAFAARELNYLAGCYPDVFDMRSKAQLRRMPSMLLSPDQRFWFKRLFKTLSIAGGLPSTEDSDEDPGDAPDGEDDPWRATFLGAAGADQQKAMLTRLLTGDGGGLSRHATWLWREMDPSMRRWYARAVGQARKRDEAQRLRRSYANEDEPEVRAAIIRTLGLAGGEVDVTWLSRRAGNVQLRRDALLAIARIHLPAGTGFLEQELEAARTAKQRDEITWLEYLLGPVFAETEHRAGRR